MRKNAKFLSNLANDNEVANQKILSKTEQSEQKSEKD